jgi:hypothetical protein
MSRRNVLIAAAAIIVSVVAIIIGWQLGRDRQKTDELETVEPLEQIAVDGPTMVAELYFPGPGGRLFAEERELPVADDLPAQLQVILDGVVAGPVSERLYPALPPELTVDWIQLNPSGTLYVDLKFAGENTFPSWGSRQEMLAVYSVVNTILANTSEIASVVILRNGQQQPTFAGHLDTSRPLLANQQLIANQ